MDRSTKESAPQPVDRRPRPPLEPDPEDCCGEGCVRCVYDVYDDKMARYKAALAAWQKRHPDADASRAD